MGEDKLLNTATALICVAVFLICGAGIWYPLLDEYLYGLFLAFGVAAAILAYASTGPLAQYIAFLRRILVLAGIVLVLFPIFSTLNVVFDHLPPVQAETRVIRKYITGSRRQMVDYNLVVSPSWREGRDHETVVLPTQPWYDSIAVGELVRVEVHPGKFGLPWGARITNPPRPD